MSDKEKTAIDWLVHHLHQGKELLTIIPYAKQMEKEQITTAYLTGIMHPLEMEATKQAEQYYNEIYNTIK
jgi:hypothetical protein